MKLIICEKPKVAQTLANALSSSPKRYQTGQAYYFSLEKDGEEIFVASAVGHIYTLREKKRSFEYPSFDIEWVPSHYDKEYYYTKQYLVNLNELGKKAEEIINACDYDIEGSLIGYNIMRFLGEKKSNLKRMKFSTLTSEELKEAYAKRSDLDCFNAYAGETRHYLDWFWGINWSRALMKALRTKNIFKTLSVGRVQGPALKILVEREREIIGFVSEEFFIILALCKGSELRGEKRFSTKEEAKECISKEGKVIQYEKWEQNFFPFPPYDLTSLQMDAYRYLGFSPTRTLELAQSLYESSFISYPRTSSQKLPYSLNLPSILYKLANFDYSARKLVEGKRFKPFEGKAEDPAHPAIYPTGIIGKMTDDESKLYNLILKRFLSCFFEPALIEKTKVAVDAKGNVYRGEGDKVLKKGWLEVFSFYKIEEANVPEFKEGENVNFDKMEIKKDKTKPSSRYSQASIIKTLEDKGLGTKATRAVIIDTLYKRGYITGKTIRATNLGVAVCQALENSCPEILDEKLTRGFEEEMEKIQEGKIKPELVVNEGKEFIGKVLLKFKEMEKEVGGMLARSLSIGKCPVCGNDLRMIYYNGKKFVGCSGYPNCRRTFPVPQDASILPTGETCEVCKSPIITIIRGRRKYDACLNEKCPTKPSNRKPAEPEKEKEKQQEKTEEK